jgi:hypothetical protein
MLQRLAGWFGTLSTVAGFIYSVVSRWDEVQKVGRGMTPIETILYGVGSVLLVLWAAKWYEKREGRRDRLIELARTLALNTSGQVNPKAYAIALLQEVEAGTGLPLVDRYWEIVTQLEQGIGAKGGTDVTP